MLSVENLTVRYGHIEAVREVSFRVEEGEIVALIGANGAGKTTILRAVSGIIPPAGGAIRFGDEEVTRCRPADLVERGIVQVPEGRLVIGALSVRDNLLLGTYRRRPRPTGGAVERELEGIFRLFPILGTRGGQRAGTLSGGEQQMLAIGRALMAQPRLLMLDEPSLGLAPLVAREIFRILGELATGGMTILLVEQNARAALGLAGRGYVMETGRVVAEGAGRALLNNPRLRGAYLGRGTLKPP